MVRMFVRHQVGDYATWRKGYDDFDEKRSTMGVSGHAVYRSVEDGNDVTAYHDFDSIDAARSFAGSNDLKEAMQQAGVVGAPQIWFVEEA